MSPVPPGFPSALAGSAALPAAIVPAVDPAAIADAPAPVRAAASFLLVLLFGGAILHLFEGFVVDAVESSMERPLASMGYGVVAQATVVYLGVYALSQVTAVATGGAAADVTTVGVGVLVVGLASLGFTVVGVRVVGAFGEHGRWRGLVVGAAVSGVVWLLPSFVLALLVWVVVAGVGVGGPVRNWTHASQAVATEDESE